MMLVKPYVPAQYREKATFDRLGNPITKKIKVSYANPSLNLIICLTTNYGAVFVIFACRQAPPVGA